MPEEFPNFGTRKVPVKTGEFRTARQRAGCSLHEISCRARYKPQLPEHFIRRHTRTGASVFDSLPQNYGPSEAAIFSASADSLNALGSGTVDMVVTSPPFFNEVDYLANNWMRMWFAKVSLAPNTFWKLSSLQKWKDPTHTTFLEMLRVVKPGGMVAFGVGEVRKGKIALENEVLRTGIRAGFEPLEILINSQKFTKTPNCRGIDNNQLGSNLSCAVLFCKPL